MMSPLRLTLLLCVVQLLVMTGSLTFQALIPVFIQEWQLTNTQAAWIGGASYVGYALAAPTLVALTDRLDARRIVICACVLGGVGGLGFAFAADGFWSAMAWRFITGIAVAGSYMPGLKALTDRLPEGPASGRAQALYSATFSLASATSLLAAGLLTQSLGWRAAFAVTGLTALLAAGLMLALPARQPTPSAGAGNMATRIHAVLRDRPAMRYIAAYAAHSWEMFAFRTWIVAFLTFATAASGADGAVVVSIIATILVLAGLPAGLLGNELAARTDRRRGVAALMLGAAVLAVATGLATSQSFLIVAILAIFYGALLMADNSAILVGTIQSTPTDRRGAAIAIQTFFAAFMALVSPLAVGSVLDAFDSGHLAWTMAFIVMALGPIAGATILLWNRRG